ncbi:MAG: hypothetical protein Q8W44_04230 [Candidatus Palauibacterales bacterium]|nr:hypothetical protein [Candidatus Palauibacterales bacterium]
MRRSIAALTAVLATALVAVACESGPTDAGASASVQGQRAGPDVVQVAAGHHTFVTSHEEIGAGWTTFRFRNRSDAPHFMIIEKMPVWEGEQKTVEDSRSEVVPVFQNIMDSFRDEGPTFPEAGFELPAWYGEVTFVGGPGLTSPGETAETRTYLEPGTYVIECYVKTEDGTFHSTEGMIEGLVVNGASNASGEPPRGRVDGRVTVSSTGGITVESAPRRPGNRTLEVAFEDQTAYSHFLGHDVHLARLDEGADREALGAWMNWAVPGGLTDDVPEGVTFLGGVQDMPAGESAYMTADLAPGRYALVAEVPDPADKGMMVEFTIP